MYFNKRCKHYVIFVLWFSYIKNYQILFILVESDLEGFFFLFSFALRSKSVFFKGLFSFFKTVCITCICMPKSSEDQIPPELKLQAVMSTNLNPGIQTGVLWESNIHFNHWAISPAPWADFYQQETYIIKWHFLKYPKNP